MTLKELRELVAKHDVTQAVHSDENHEIKNYSLARLRKENLLRQQFKAMSDEQKR